MNSTVTEAEEEPYFIPDDWEFDGEMPKRICLATDDEPDPFRR
jgi:hypothetical protein